jgi:hypothetical protein
MHGGTRTTNPPNEKIKKPTGIADRDGARVLKVFLEPRTQMRPRVAYRQNNPRRSDNDSSCRHFQNTLWGMVVEKELMTIPTSL